MKGENSHLNAPPCEHLAPQDSTPCTERIPPATLSTCRPVLYDVHPNLDPPTEYAPHPDHTCVPARTRTRPEVCRAALQCPCAARCELRTTHTRDAQPSLSQTYAALGTPDPDPDFRPAPTCFVQGHWRAGRRSFAGSALSLCWHAAPVAVQGGTPNSGGAQLSWLLSLAAGSVVSKLGSPPASGLGTCSGLAMV